MKQVKTLRNKLKFLETSGKLQLVTNPDAVRQEAEIFKGDADKSECVILLSLNEISVKD